MGWLIKYYSYSFYHPFLFLVFCVWNLNKQIIYYRTKWMQQFNRYCINSCGSRPQRKEKKISELVHIFQSSKIYNIYAKVQIKTQWSIHNNIIPHMLPLSTTDVTAEPAVELLFYILNMLLFSLSRCYIPYIYSSRSQLPGNFPFQYYSFILINILCRLNTILILHDFFTNIHLCKTRRTG